jgi:hypothetical protein
MSGQRGLLHNDEIIPECRHVDGTYHVDGALIIAPADMFTKSIKVYLPLLICATEAKKLVLSPIPRYWLHRCC